MSKERSLAVQVYSSFAELAPAWRTLDCFKDHPALDASWLEAFESSGCVNLDRGWLPHHLALYDGPTLLAATCAYIKLHSEGEFVFDHVLARAAPKFGIRYYPKLLVAVPFTPANGPRIGVPSSSSVFEGAGIDRHTNDVQTAAPLIAGTLNALVAQRELSSAHVLFLPDDEAAALADVGMIRRRGVQFHWRNPGYRDFEDFLKTLPSKRRTQIRRERRAVAEQGLELDFLTGERLDPAMADELYRLYLTTVDKFLWGRRYLNRAFFETVLGSMKHRIEIVAARDSKKRIVACAFNLRGPRTLYGRYWGTHVELPFLHFNICYYASIERCIAEKIQLFEPGAGGEHKEARGFEATLTNSVHLIRDPRFAAAIRESFEHEREVLERELSKPQSR